MNAARPGQVAMQRGFTLVELMVTLTILVMLLMIAVPAVLRAIQNARTSTLVHRLPQDVAWARNQSATTPALYRITLGSGCQWKIELADLSGATPSWTTNAQTQARSITTTEAASASRLKAKISRATSTLMSVIPPSWRAPGAVCAGMCEFIMSLSWR